MQRWQIRRWLLPTHKLQNFVNRRESQRQGVDLHNATMPPSYGSREYWEERFATETSFDWLLSTSKALAIVYELLQSCGSDDDVEVLHIGCGNSELSHALPGVVGAKARVTNVDFSERVVETAKDRAEAGDGSRRDRDECSTEWVAADLLSADDICEKLLNGPGDRPHQDKGDIVVDKGTSDSISCGEDVCVSLPYPIRLRQHLQGECRSQSSKNTSSVLGSSTSNSSVHPLYLLALHLALLASRPGSRWLVFSYSAERFDFLDSRRPASRAAQGDRHGPEAEFPDPWALWRLREKWSLDVSGEKRGSSREPGEGKEGRIVHRPPELCWVYVLERTGAGVELRKE